MFIFLVDVRLLVTYYNFLIHKVKVSLVVYLLILFIVRFFIFAMNLIYKISYYFRIHNNMRMVYLLKWKTL